MRLQDSGFHESSGQIPVWKRNGKFVSFFRSFIGSKPPKEKIIRLPVFGTELAKLLSDTGDEGRYLVFKLDNNTVH